jgi:hypothetical protein
MKKGQVIGLILASMFLFNYAVVPVHGAQAQAKQEYKISLRTDRQAITAAILAVPDNDNLRIEHGDRREAGSRARVLCRAHW